MKTAFCVPFVILVMVGCATASRHSSGFKVVKVAPLASPQGTTKTKVGKIPQAISPKPPPEKTPDVRDYADPTTLALIASEKSKDVEIHRLVAESLLLVSEETRFSAAACLAELRPDDPEIFQSMGDVLEQALLDRGFDANPGRLKFAKNLLQTLSGKPKVDTELEAVVLEVIDDGTVPELQVAAMHAMASWKVISKKTQLELWKRAHEKHYTPEIRTELITWLENLERPDPALVDIVIEAFAADEDMLAREEALALLVRWRPSDKAVIAKLMAVGIAFEEESRAPASISKEDTPVLAPSTN